MLLGVRVRMDMSEKLAVYEPMVASVLLGAHHIHSEIVYGTK